MCKTTNRATQVVSPSAETVRIIVKPPIVVTPPPGLFPDALTFATGTPSQVFTDAFNAVATNSKFKNLRFALTDITGPQPIYLGHNDQQHTFIASTAKIAVLYTALWLRKTVRENAKNMQAANGNELLDKLKTKWNSVTKIYPGKFAGHAWPPDLHKIFQVNSTGVNQWEIDFKSDLDYTGSARLSSMLQIATKHNQSMTTINALGFRDRLELMIGWSDNNATGSCVNALGFQFINGCLSEAALFVPGTGGLWLSGNYAGTNFSNDFKNISPQKITTQGGTALAMSQFMVLVAKRLLIDSATSQDILTMMNRVVEDELWDKDYNTCWARDELEKKSRTIPQCFAKVGVYGASYSEIACITEERNGKLLKYVIGCSKAPSEQRLKDLAVALSDVVAANH